MHEVFFLCPNDNLMSDEASDGKGRTKTAIPSVPLTPPESFYIF